MGKAVMAATIGCGLEFYDFVTFAFFAIQIGNTFFPSHDKYLSLMGSLATFGAGFLGRPVGAYVLGGLADRIGRRSIMLFSMMLMGGAIAVLALTPGYASIGIAAPIIAILCRVTQGFALGGEIGAATVYMVEAADESRRAFSASWQGVCQNVGASAGALAGFLLSLELSPDQLSSFGWRIALLLGVCVVPFGLWMRRTIPETLEAAQAPDSEVGSAAISISRIAILGILIIGAGTIATYIFNYMATYAQNEMHLSTAAGMAGELIGNGVSIFACLAGGWLSDRYGRRPMQVWPQLTFCLTIVPCFLWLTHVPTVGVFLTVNIILSILSTIWVPATYAAVAENLDPSVRSRGFALIYSLPVTFLGGSTQLVVTWLLRVTGEPLSIAWYLTGASVVGLVAMLLLPESAPVRRGLKALSASA